MASSPAPTISLAVLLILKSTDVALAATARVAAVMILVESAACRSPPCALPRTPLSPTQHAAAPARPLDAQPAPLDAAIQLVRGSEDHPLIHLRTL
jgi:hypothetical protein